MAAADYNERIQDEIKQVPEEYLPALWEIVHAFREGVSLKSAEVSLEQGWREAQQGETQPIDTLWEGIES